MFRHKPNFQIGTILKKMQGDDNSGGGAPFFATMRRMDMGRSAEEIKKDIESGNTALGIEFWFDPNQRQS